MSLCTAAPHYVQRIMAKRRSAVENLGAPSYSRQRRRNTEWLVVTAERPNKANHSPDPETPFLETVKQLLKARGGSLLCSRRSRHNIVTLQGEKRLKVYRRESVVRRRRSSVAIDFQTPQHPAIEFGGP